MVARSVLALAVLPSLASAASCASYADCGGCISETDLWTHTCHWCEVDQKCHALGSSDSSCATSLENDHCVSLGDASSCHLKSCPAPEEAFRAQQVHIALAGPDGMRIMWKTHQAPQQCQVEFSGQSVPSDGYQQYKSDHGFHHVATLKGLQQGGVYDYIVNCDGAKTDVRSFKIPAGDLDHATFLVVGDIGTGERGHAVASKQRMDALIDSVDATIHVGDIGYADDSFLHSPCTTYFCYEAVYNEYMEGIRNLADQKPYMVTPGNHEVECHSPNCVTRPDTKHALANFSAYNARFKMPSQESGGVMSMWYSFDYGPVHFVAVNTESDYPDAPEKDKGVAGPASSPCGHFVPDGDFQRWLEADLEKANQNRGRVPFIVPFGHRTYVVGEGKAQDEMVGAFFKPIFEKYHVDMYLAGHIHAYSSNVPTNGGPAVIATGGAGCDEDNEGYGFTQGEANGWKYYSVGNVYQVGTLTATRDELTWKAHNSETGEVFDTVTVTSQAVAEVV